MPAFPLRAAEKRPAEPLLHVHRAAVVHASLEDTFAFFSDAANLQQLTPPWLRFTICTPLPITMREGTEIEYRIRVRGIPIPWRTRVDVWEPGVRFVDRQIFGPYVWWRHEHLFQRVPAGTFVLDLVDFLPRAGWVSRRLVERDVARIFDYRADALQRVFARSYA
jgi:ligand-binding SRPBCC domain-containing protein